MECSLVLDSSLDPCPVRAALIWAEGIQSPLPSEELPDLLAELVERAREAGEDFWPQAVKARVRDMLRHGKYKPAGRGKPASEFLLKAAMAQQFPSVNPPVDVNNAISLESGLPGTIFDLKLSGPDLLLRRGQPGESYVFNRTGQGIDLQDLLLVCRRHDGEWQPCGNPVKDSMDTKIQDSTRDVVAVLYAPADEASAEVGRWAKRYAEALRSHCEAERVTWRVVESED